MHLPFSRCLTVGISQMTSDKWWWFDVDFYSVYILKMWLRGRSKRTYRIEGNGVSAFFVANRYDNFKGWRVSSWGRYVTPKKEKKKEKKNWQTENFYLFDYRLSVYQFFFAFCYFVIDDFILDFFSDTRKSLYCKIS